MNELDLFAAAIAITEPTERAALLERECAGRPDLRRRLDQLLEAHFRPDPLLDRPGLDPTGDDSATEIGDRPTEDQSATEPTLSGTILDPVRDQSAAGIVNRDDRGRDERAGTVVAGRYTLVEVVGEGGMGSVWRAKQTEPVKRFVAVKLIKAGMDSRQVLARFDAERQALALMDHPNIAKVLDGGLHEGRPYFVMELVKGVPITEFCDARRLTPRERLELFVPVCQAIQHAHQKGIIHRDIKPSNVLIALYDDHPVPKVIDFGVAKATGGTLTEHTIDTGFGGVVGTPQYMSPEQATFNNLDVDTRSDVYALGVLLYELLTGSPPFSKADLEKRGVLEMLRVVREEEPPRPSTRLSTADALPTLSANRGSDPRSLTGLLRNELDWVVMKALEKDRARRYETANGFAADVQRYLNGEAVQAHPPSAGYRMQKFVRRNRPQVMTAGLVLLALVAGVIGTTVGLFEAKKQQRLAVAAADAERMAREREAERAEGERLAKLDAQAKAIEAQRARARAEAGEKLAGERLVQVEAEKKRADEEGRTTWAVKEFLRTKLLAQADVRAQANALMRAGGPAAEAKPNPTVRELLDRAAAELAPDRIEANFPAQPLVQAALLGTIGDAYRGVGEAATGIPYLIRSVDLFRAKLGPDHHDTLAYMNNLAQNYLVAGKLDPALPLQEEVLKRTKATLGPDHPDTLMIMSNLAILYLDDRKPDLALPLLEETLKLRKAKLGPDHTDTLISMVNLAEGYKSAGKPDLALRLLEETLALMKTKLGPDHPETHTAMNNLAQSYRAAGKLDLALPLLEETLKLRKARLGPDHPETLISMNNLAVCYRSLNQTDLAVPLFEEVLALRERKLGRDHPETQRTVKGLGVAYLDAGRAAEAIPLLEEAHRASKRNAQSYAVANDAGVILMDAYARVGKPAEATKLIDEVIADARQALPKDSPLLAARLAQVGLALLEMKRFVAAEPPLREALAIRETHEADDWKTFNTHSLLGGALLGQEKYADAEPLLKKGYEGMKAREKQIPPQAGTRIPEALDRLIELSTATNRPDEAAKWRAERAKYPEAKPSDKK